MRLIIEYYDYNEWCFKTIPHIAESKEQFLFDLESIWVYFFEGSRKYIAPKVYTVDEWFLTKK